jgi:hypothetical protein
MDDKLAGMNLNTVRKKVLDIDLHGYYPSDIVDTGALDRLVQQCWEMGMEEICFIHGHGRNRGISPGFKNTNTGRFGLAVRRNLRHHTALRQWIMHTTLNCKDPGKTSFRLKRNPRPIRMDLDFPEAGITS